MKYYVSKIPDENEGYQDSEEREVEVESRRRELHIHQLESDQRRGAAVQLHVEAVVEEVRADVGHVQAEPSEKVQEGWDQEHTLLHTKSNLGQNK